MRRRPMKLLLAVLLGSLLPGCGFFDFTGQSIALRHDPEADALEVELTYHGVMALSVDDYTDETEQLRARAMARSLAEAADGLEELTQGARRFMIAVPSLEFDLDRAVTGREGESDLEQRTWQWAQGVSVLECRVEHDDRERLSVYQKLRLADLSTGVKLFNEGWCQSLIEWSQEKEFVQETPYFDDRTRELMVEQARAGRGPFDFDSGGLTLALAMTGASAARVLAHVSRELAIEDAEYWALLLEALLEPAADLEISGERVKMRYLPDETGVLRIELPGMTREYDPSLDEYLRARDFAIPARY